MGNTDDSKVPLGTKLILIIVLGVILNIGPFILINYYSSGWSHWTGKITHTRDVIERMDKPDGDTYAAHIFYKYKEAQTNYYVLQTLIDDRIGEISKTLLTTNQAGEIKDWLEVRKKCSEVIAEELPFHVAGFAEERQICLQMVYSIALAILLFVAIPGSLLYGKSGDGEKKPPLLTLWHAYGCGIIYCFLLNVPWFMRYILNIYGTTLEEGRRSFGFYAWDINRSAWLCVTLEGLFFAIMLGHIWIKWHNFRREWKYHAEICPRTGTKQNKTDIFRHLNENVSDLFHNWQINSLILAAAFLPWSYFDWSHSHMGHNSDTRTAYLALIDHVTWMGTWVLISAPLLEGLNFWRKSKLKLLLQPKKSCEYPEGLDNDQWKLIENTEPISDLKLIGVSIAAVVSFIIPLAGIFK